MEASALENTPSENKFNVNLNVNTLHLNTDICINEKEDMNEKEDVNAQENMNEDVDVDEDVFDIAELNFLRDTIESMSKFNQIEVLRILKQYNCVTLNENKYGVHINLTELKREIIENLKAYINYVNAQEYNLNEIEQQKETFKNIYFPKDNKDISLKNSKNAPISAATSI
jgi:hypothetical protein